MGENTCASEIVMGRKLPEWAGQTGKDGQQVERGVCTKGELDEAGRCAGRLRQPGCGGA